MHLGRYDKALADYNTAIRIAPRYANAYVNRGALHHAMKKYRLALEDWERALPLVRGTAWEQKVAGLIRKARSLIK